MKYITVAFATTALLTGLVAAWNWYKVSNVRLAPERRPAERGIAAILAVTVDPVQAARATISAIQEAAGLIRLAAIWTAVAVIFGGLSNLLGSLSN